MIGIEDQFAVVGDYGDLLDYYGLTAEKLADRINKLLTYNSSNSILF